MNSYLGFFSKGLLEIEKEIVKQKFDDANILSYGDDYILFATDQDIYSNDLYFFKKFFKVIKYFDSDYALEHQLAWLGKNLHDLQLEDRKYRIVVSKYKINQKDYLIKVSEIENGMRGLGVSIDNGHPDFEIKIVEKENYGFIGIDLPLEKLFTKDRIDMDVAYCMNQLSDMSADDVFLDPFCGFGTIPVLRSLKHFEQIIASDLDISKINQNLKIKNQRLTIVEQNFFNSKLSDISINKIVTDPPWDGYSEISDLEVFYMNMFNKFEETLMANGLLVLLTNQKEIIQNIHNSKLKLLDEYEVLVSGKEAKIYKFIKT